MRIAVLIMLLAVVSNSAMAEWTMVDANGSDYSITFTDSSTIKKVGDKVKMWVMKDFTTAQTIADKTYFSILWQIEIDCKEEESRLIATYKYSENMGKGNAVYGNSGTGKWEPIVPGSTGKIIWELACK